MFEIQKTNESLYKNYILLNLNDSEIEKNYQMIKYRNKRYLFMNVFYFFLALGFIVFALSNKDNIPRLFSSSSYFLEICIVIIMVFNVIFLIFIFPLNKEKYFNMLSIVSFCNMLSQKIIIKKICLMIIIIIKDDFSLTYYDSIVINFIDYSMRIIYFIFIDADFIKSLLTDFLSCIDLYIFFKKVGVFDLSMYTMTFFSKVFNLLIIYYLEKNHKENFYFSSVLSKKQSNLKVYFDNIDIGATAFKNNIITYTNNYLKSIFDQKSYRKEEETMYICKTKTYLQYSNSETKVSITDILSDIEFTDEFYSLQTLINKNIKLSKENQSGMFLINNEQNLNIDKHFTMNIRETSQSIKPINTQKGYDYHEILNFIKNNSFHFQNFYLIGNKVISSKYDNPTKDSNFQIWARYNEIDQEVEMLFKNVSIISNLKELREEARQKSFILSKMIHEFKNPLICIIEIIKKMDLVDYRNNYRKVVKKDININKESFQHIDNISSSDSDVNEIGNIIIENEEEEEEQGNKHSNYHEDLNYIKNLSEFMMILIKDIDTLNIMEMNKDIELNIEQTNLENLIKFCIEIFKTRAKLNSKNIFFVYEISNDIPSEIKTDELRLKQILINLLSNSYKFTPSGIISVEVKSIEKKQDKVQYICFKISDTGIGINKEKINSLNMPFCKLESKDNIYGTGLGLNIVKDMVSLLNGSNEEKISVVSIENQGTSISFKIPINIKNEAMNFEDSDNQNKEKEENIILYQKKGSGFSFKKEEEFFQRKNSIKKKSVINNSNTNTTNLQIFDFYVTESIKDELHICNLDDTLEIRNNIIQNSQNVSIRPVNKKLSVINDSPILKHLNSKYDSKNNKTVTFKDSVNSSEIKKSSPNKKLSTNSVISYINENILMRTERIINKKHQKYFVIIVEDEKLIRESHKNLFFSYCKNNNFEIDVTECIDGAECIYKIFKGLNLGIQYDAVITDESMFFIKGSLLCDILSGLISEKILNPINIFLASSYEPSDEKMMNLSNKVKGIFNKPLNLGNINRICKSFIII